jgi:hypothetical protein
LLFHYTIIVVIREPVGESPAASSRTSRPLGRLNRAALDALIFVSRSPLPESIDD